MQESFFNRPFVTPALFLSLALLGGLAVVGWGISARNQQNTISTTGSASQNIKADEATWAVDVRRSVYESGVAAADVQVARDAAAVEKFFKAKKLASSTVTLSTIYTDIDYSQYKQSSGEPTLYSVHETVTVQTTDVDTIDALSRDLASLNAVIANGSLLSPQPPQYYVSTLPALRVSLIGQAIADAKARAVQIAQSGGGSVGPLQSASSGVVQVLAPNSIDVEGYGAYDTSTIQKEVMVTAHASFYVR